jgi:hypothetical protein
MIQACADAVAGLVEEGVRGAPLLSAASDLRRVSAIVAVAVAEAAAAQGLAQVELVNPIQQVHDAMCQLVYPAIEPVQPSVRPRCERGEHVVGQARPNPCRPRAELPCGEPDTGQPGMGVHLQEGRCVAGRARTP